MRVGRPPLGASLVEGLEGGEVEKERLRAILETLAGEVTIEEACSSVGLRRSRFCELRERVLRSGLEALSPRPPGRPSGRVEIDAAELEDLRRLVGWQREELVLARVRTELALVMPHVLREPESEPPVVRGKSAARARRKAKRSGARRNGTTRT